MVLPVSERESKTTRLFLSQAHHNLLVGASVSNTTEPEKARIPDSQGAAKIKRITIPGNGPRSILLLDPILASSKLGSAEQACS